MSPTILRTASLRVVIFPKDHSPPHVHVFGPEGEAKFEIDTLDCISSTGFPQRTLWKIQCYLLKHQSYLKEAWNEWQEK